MLGKSLKKKKKIGKRYPTECLVFLTLSNL